MAYVVECPNCSEPFLRKRRKIFCSPACQQTTELIRYARRKRREGTFDRPDIMEAIRIRLSHIIGNGGYDKRARQIPDELRSKIFAEADGKCQNCGKTFEVKGDYRPTIQHCKGASHNDADIQAWCFRCNMDHALSLLTTNPTPEQVSERALIVERWEAPQALRVVDDDELWPNVWRTFCPNQLSMDEFEDLADYYDSLCEFNTGSADGDAYFAHVMDKD